MSRKFNQTLIDGETAANTAGYINPVSAAHSTEFGFYIEFDHTSAAGQVLIETADSDDYAGTWAILATVNWSAIDKCHYVALTNAVRSIRARISTAVTSGTVTVKAVGNMV